MRALPLTISHSKQLNKLVREYDRKNKTHNHKCLCRIADAMMFHVAHNAGEAQEMGLTAGLEIANALISSTLKNPKVYAVLIDGYTFYFVGNNVKSIIKRLGSTHE